MSLSIRKIKTSRGNTFFQRSRDPNFEVGTVEWLRRDLYRRWSWKSIVNAQVQEIVSSCSVDCLESEGFAELSKGVYMLETELPKHADKNEVNSVGEVEDNDVFARAADCSAHTRRMHRAVDNWPQWIPRTAPGYRLWESIQRIAARESSTRALPGQDA